ncbi:MAG: ABC1 kinase family protein, partial [Microcoleaceae cyanobacterium]
MSVKTLSPETPTNSSSQQIVPIQIAITDDIQTIDLDVETITDATDEEELPPDISQEEAITLRYDPEAIADFYRHRPLEVWSRRISVVWIFVTFALSLWTDRQTDSVKKNELKRAARLREILTFLGPAFIKVGQALSTRPDLVPPAYLEELAKLQDQLPPFPNEIAFQFIEEELGAPPQEIYAELSDHPLAAASLGQVYRGKLKTGEEVAVKVQRPGLAERIALDIYILRSLAMWANNNVKKIRSDLVAIMDEFGHRIYEEMDYAHEGRNAEKFDRLYGNLPEIYVPKIHWQYTGRRVLTMEWINGTKLTDLEAVQAQGIDAKHLIEVGVQCSLRQLLEHGFFHADP